MKIRLQTCIEQMAIQPWSDQIKQRKRKVKGGLLEENSWMWQAIRWYPPLCGGLNGVQCKRLQGGQFTKWDDGI